MPTAALYSVNGDAGNRGWSERRCPSAETPSAQAACTWRVLPEGRGAYPKRQRPSAQAVHRSGAAVQRWNSAGNPTKGNNATFALVPISTRCSLSSQLLQSPVPPQQAVFSLMRSNWLSLKVALVSGINPLKSDSHAATPCASSVVVLQRVPAGLWHAGDGVVPGWAPRDDCAVPAARPHRMRSPLY